MTRYRLTIEYHGGPFVGWQKQDNGPSVQGAIEHALSRLGERDTLVYGSGRTDAGVHALGQVAHVDLQKDWEPFRLSEALNHHLKPDPIAIVAAQRVGDGFHARFSAVLRRYLYRIAPRRAPLTFDRGLAWRVSPPLDIASMRAGGAYLVGKHDFTTFRASQCQAASPIKSIDSVTIAETPSGMIEVRCEARSFLHNQVRSIVGTLERVGAGAWAPEDVRTALEAANRAACGPVAPPDGLYLAEVVYPEGAEYSEGGGHSERAEYSQDGDDAAEPAPPSATSAY
ncbi:MAG: tRNA pseudouridine(38-40) synthase TruA [Neomegalonema sp.]|nr:tRNA pseudouridine(38-40) synthase TruA [Neomegalonema sp.]